MIIRYRPGHNKYFPKSIQHIKTENNNVFIIGPFWVFLK